MAVVKHCGSEHLVIGLTSNAWIPDFIALLSYHLQRCHDGFVAAQPPHVGKII
jgi:hypothetical protein